MGCVASGLVGGSNGNGVARAVSELVGTGVCLRDARMAAGFLFESTAERVWQLEIEWRGFVARRVGNARGDLVLRSRRVGSGGAAVCFRSASRGGMGLLGAGGVGGGTRHA